MKRRRQRNWGVLWRQEYPEERQVKRTGGLEESSHETGRKFKTRERSHGFVREEGPRGGRRIRTKNTQAEARAACPCGAPAK